MTGAFSRIKNRLRKNRLSSSLFFGLLLPMIVVFILGVILLYQVIPVLIEKNVVDDAVRSAEQTAAQYKAFRKYYTENVTQKVLKKSSLRMSFDHKNNSRTIPLPTTMIQDLGAELDSDVLRIDLYSPFPFLNRESRKLDSFGLDAWKFLKDNPDKSYVQKYDKDGAQVVRVGIADVMVTDDCVNCHNSHDLSPKTDWSVGDVRGVLEVDTNISAQLLDAKTLSLQIIAMLTLMIFVLLLVTAWVFKHKVTGPLDSAVNIANLISEGDLVTHDSKLSGDEVGRLRKSLRMMKIRLAVVINSIRSGAHSVSEAAEQVSQGNTNLSQRTQEQASSLEEIASTMEEMTETVNHNAENASKAKELAVDANESAKKSLVVVSTTIGAMAKIEKSSKEIADIIRVIENIAFQTNLLALNAAVEAARAGEQGRGFAVVASEVRELAGRSAKAAKEIKELIEDSVSKVEDGSELIDETAVALSEINTSVENVAEIITEIAAASKEQSEGINQVNKALMQMDEMTQSNASLVEEAAAASEAMGAQAEELTSLVSYFKLNESITGIVERVEDNVKKIREIKETPSQTALPEQQRQSNEDGDWKDF